MVCTYSPPETAHLEKLGTTHAHKEYDNSLVGFNLSNLVIESSTSVKIFILKGFKLAIIFMLYFRQNAKILQ